MTLSPLKRGKTLAKRDGIGCLSPVRDNGDAIHLHLGFYILHNTPSLQNCLKRMVVECFFGENGNLGLTKNMVQRKLPLESFSLT